MEILGRIMVSLAFHAQVDATHENLLFLGVELWREGRGSACEVPRCRTSLMCLLASQVQCAVH